MLYQKFENLLRLISSLLRLISSPSLMISASVVRDALAPTESKFFVSLLTLIKSISKQATTLWNYLSMVCGKDVSKKIYMFSL